MTLRLSDCRFWVLFGALVVGVLAACSGDNSPSGGSPSNDAATSGSSSGGAGGNGSAPAPDAMTKG